MSTTAMNQMSNTAVAVGNDGDMSEPERAVCQDNEASSSLFEFITSLGDAVVGCAATSNSSVVTSAAAPSTDGDLFSNPSSGFYIKSSAQTPLTSGTMFYDNASNNKQLKRQPGSAVNSSNLFKSSLLGHPIHHHSDTSANTTNNTSSSTALSSSKLVLNSNKIANSACSTTSSASSSAKSSSSSSSSSTNETPVINLNFNNNHHHHQSTTTKLKPSILSAAAAAATTQTAKQMSALLMQHNSLSHQLKNNTALSSQQPQQQAQQPTAFKKMDSFTDDDSSIFSSPLAPSTPPMSPLTTAANVSSTSASMFMQPNVFNFSSIASTPSTNSLLPQTPMTSVNVNTPASWPNSSDSEKTPVSASSATTSGNSGAAPSQKSNQKSNTSSGSSGASTATATSSSGALQQAAVKAGHHTPATNNTHHHQAASTQFNIEYELIKYTKNLKLNSHPYSAHYRLGAHVRNGGFSEIYEGMRLRNNEKVIIKLIPKHKTKNWLMVNNKKYPAEILLHKMCNNISGVVRMLEFYEQDHEWIIIMPKLKNCMDLFDYLESKQKGRLSEREACEFFRQLVQINIDLLNTGVVHRDIKSENLLVDMDSMRLVLIDFGASAIFRNNGAHTSNGQHYYYTDFHGTKQYKPPEYITNKKYTAQASTIWTLGTLLIIY